MTVRVDLGGGNFAELEPELYEVDRSLLEDGPQTIQAPSLVEGARSLRRLILLAQILGRRAGMPR